MNAECAGRMDWASRTWPRAQRHVHRKRATRDSIKESIEQRSAPPARCPEPTRALPAMYHSSAPRLSPPSPYLSSPCVRLHRTMPCHGARPEYAYSSVPSFGQTFPNKVGPCQNRHPEGGCWPTASPPPARRRAHWRVTGTVNMPFTNETPLT